MAGKYVKIQPSGIIIVQSKVAIVSQKKLYSTGLKPYTVCHNLHTKNQRYNTSKTRPGMHTFTPPPRSY